VIQPDGLLEHARRLAGKGRGRPPDADLRRGVSAAYYSLYHDLTERAVHHLIPSSPAKVQNALRRSWTHAEIANAAEIVVERAKVLAHNATAALPEKLLNEFGPLVDVAASDADVVEALRLFNELQNKRHQADYDHDASFDKASLLTVCQEAGRARTKIAGASPASREALFSMLTVRRKDFGPR
jgi:hypothetical protein